MQIADVRCESCAASAAAVTAAMKATASAAAPAHQKGRMTEVQETEVMLFVLPATRAAIKRRFNKHRLFPAF
jgi:hypothetical protein